MLSIAYLTNRKVCKLEWFLSSLNAQNAEFKFPIDLLVIDYYGREKEFKELAKIYEHLSDIRVYKPKPSVWQGEHRLTKRDYFCAAGARNTALIAASVESDYIVFADDLSVLSPSWLAQVVHAYHNKYLVMGAYEKVKNLSVDENGSIIHYDSFPGGKDSRERFGSLEGIVPAPPEWLFGCSFGVPMLVMKAINGQDEYADPIGGEDYLTGLRIANLSNAPKMFYNLNMKTFESEELHHTNEIMLRVDKKMGESDSSHHILSMCQNFRQTWSYWNNFSLKQARYIFQTTGEFPPAPNFKNHWPDNQLLSEM